MNDQPHIQKKCTNRQISEMVDYVAQLVARCASKTQIHAAVEAKFNKGWRQADRYTARARVLLAERAQISSGEMKDLVVNGLLQIVMTGGEHVRVRALRELAMIAGIYAPQQHMIATPPGQPFQTEDVTETPTIPKNRLVQILAALNVQGNGGNGNGNGNGHGDMGIPITGGNGNGGEPHLE